MLFNFFLYIQHKFGITCYNTIGLKSEKKPEQIGNVARFERRKIYKNGSV